MPTVIEVPEAGSDKQHLNGNTHERIRLGLRGRLGLLYLMAVFLIIGTMIWLSIASLTRAFNDEYRDKALAIIITLEAQYGPLFQLQNSNVTQAAFDRLMSLNPNIGKISLYAPVNGKIIRTASSDRSQIGEPADEFDMEPLKTGQPVFHENTDGGEKLVEVLAPLHADGRPVAVIGVYLRLAPRDAFIRTQAITLIAIGAAATTLLLAILYLVQNMLLLKPLATLRKSALAIERGWLHTRIRVARKDEFGMLAQTFNGMADALEKREKENEELHRELEDKYAEAQTMAITDAVTGLFNHRHFQDRLADELERARRFDASVALIFIDIDKFKTVNDSFGHQFGDEVLGEMANLIRGEVRAIDTVARYGGEEFAVVLPGTDRRSGQQVAERIRKVIETYHFGANPAQESAITISAGVSSYPEDGYLREDLLWKADRAMYHAKQMGRNQVRLYCELTKPKETEARQVADEAQDDQRAIVLPDAKE